MDDNDLERFASLMLGIADNFSSQITENGMRFRFEMLKQFSYEEIDRAAKYLILTRKFTKLPTIADFVSAINGDPAETAEVEAAKVVGAIRLHGAYATVVFDNATTQAVIQHGFGGWTKLCSELTEAETKWFYKDFARIYQAYSNQQVEFYGKLVGIIEAQNSANGYDEHIPNPIMIGNYDKAVKIAYTKNESPLLGDGMPSIKQLTAGIGKDVK